MLHVLIAPPYSKPKLKLVLIYIKFILVFVVLYCTKHASYKYTRIIVYRIKASIQPPPRWQELASTYISRKRCLSHFRNANVGRPGRRQKLDGFLATWFARSRSRFSGRSLAWGNSTGSGLSCNLGGWGLHVLVSTTERCSSGWSSDI